MQLFWYRRIFQAIEPSSNEIRRRYSYSSWPITRCCQFSASNVHNFQKYRAGVFESRRLYSSTAVVQEKKSRKMLIYLTALVFGMVGCSYAAVPLYRRFCQATGYGGTVQRREVRLSFVLFWCIYGWGDESCIFVNTWWTVYSIRLAPCTKLLMYIGWLEKSMYWIFLPVLNGRRNHSTANWLIIDMCCVHLVF